MKKPGWFKKISYQNTLEKTKIPFKKEITVTIIINLVLILLSSASILILPPKIPLFYSLPEGEKQLADNFLIVLPNILSLLVIIVNIILANKSQDEYIKKILIFSGIAATFFATITTLKIIFLVGNVPLI